EGIKYKYVSSNDIYAELNPLLQEVGLIFFLKEVKHRDFKEISVKYSNSEKQNFIVQAEALFLLVNVDNPTETIEFRNEVYGQQDESSKALGSGLTYTERYVLLKMLGVETDEDDPDKKSSKKEEEQDKDLNNKFAQNEITNLFNKK